jgi:polysaccharide biosynthesis protein PslH
MRILVLTTRLFGTPTSGGELCTARLLAALRDGGHEIVLVGRGNATEAAVWTPQVVSLGCIVGPFDELSRWRSLAAVASALLGRRPITVSRQRVPLSAERLAGLLHLSDAVVVDHLQAWPWLRGIRSRPVLLVNHNVESDNYMRQSLAEPEFDPGHAVSRWLRRHLMRREARGLQQLELEVLAQAQVLACLSEEDSERLSSLAERARLDARARPAVLPGYPLAPPAHRRRVSGEALPSVGLLGTWTWAPNREGLRWFLARVWPAIAGRARLVLAGSGLDGLDLPAQARVMGRVAQVSDFYDAVDVVAVVSLSGSGVQEKAIEAVGTGAAVVATRHALRGLLQDLPPHVRIEDDPARFGQACLEAGRAPCAQAFELTLQWASGRRDLYTRSVAACLSGLSGVAKRQGATDDAGLVSTS